MARLTDQHGRAVPETANRLGSLPRPGAGAGRHGLIARPTGLTPTGMSAITVLLAVLITETVLGFQQTLLLAT